MEVSELMLLWQYKQHLRDIQQTAAPSPRRHEAAPGVSAESMVCSSAAFGELYSTAGWCPAASSEAALAAFLRSVGSNQRGTPAGAQSRAAAARLAAGVLASVTTSGLETRARRCRST